MTAKYLIVFVNGFSIGMAAYATFQIVGLSLGTLGTLTTLFLSVMAVNTGSLTWLLLSEKSIERKPLETLLIAQRTTELGNVISGSESQASSLAAVKASGRSASTERLFSDDRQAYPLAAYLRWHRTDTGMEALDFRRVDF